MKENEKERGYPGENKQSEAFKTSAKYCVVDAFKLPRSLANPPSPALSP